MKPVASLIRCVAGFKLWLGGEVFTFAHAQEAADFLAAHAPGAVVEWNI